MKRIRKHVIFLLLLSMILNLAACGKGKAVSETDSSAVKTYTTESNMSEAYRKAIDERRAEYEKTGKYKKVTYAIYTWTGRPVGLERIQEAMNKILRGKLCLEIELLALDFASYRQDIQLYITNRNKQIDWYGGNVLG